MIDPAATPTASLAAGSSGAGSVLPAIPGAPADPAAFASLLSAGADAAPAEGATPASPAMPLATRQDLAGMAATTVAAGKTLPDLLPLADAATPDQPATTPAGPPVPVLPLLRAVRPREAGEPALPRAANGDDQPAATAEEPSEAAPCAVPSFVLALAPLPAPAEAATPSFAAAATPTQQPQPAPAAVPLPPAIAAQLMGQALPRQNLLPQQETSAPDDARTLRLPATAALLPALADAPLTLASPAAPSAPAGLRLRPVVEAPAPLPGTAPADMAAPGVPPAPVVDPALAGQNALPGNAAVPAGLPGLGHSFAAIVDRLMAAREAVRAEGPAQPVAVALRHAEFGTVSVRFEQRADGLSVALSSPDPDFARAVQAATPTASGNETGSSGNPGAGTFAGGNGWTASSSGAGAQSQQGQRGAGAQPERFAGAAPDPARADRAAASETGPRGIYA